MKKFALALVAATAISGAQADMTSGLYLGVNGSMNALSAAMTVTDLADHSFQKFDMGRHHVGGGMYVGYGISSGCLYYAGEIGYQFVNGSFRFNSTDPVLNGKFRARHQFNFAGRIGFKFTPSTIAYIRLGGNWTENRLHTSIAGLNNKKSRISFAPGLGMETSIGRNWVGRLEWTMDCGRSFTRTVPGVVSLSLKNSYTQSTKLGLAYKF